MGCLLTCRPARRSAGNCHGFRSFTGPKRYLWKLHQSKQWKAEDTLINAYFPWDRPTCSAQQHFSTSIRCGQGGNVQIFKQIRRTLKFSSSNHWSKTRKNILFQKNPKNLFGNNIHDTRGGQHLGPEPNKFEK